MTTSETISMFFNDYNEHNLTIYFGGETLEYMFNSSNSEIVIIELACKSLDVTVMWEDINVPIDGTSIILEYYDGTSWIDIETGVSDLNGSVSFTGLVFGNYRIDTTNFTIDQPMITYATDIFEIAVKTIIDVDYISLLAIFGDTTVDLSTIDWAFGFIYNDDFIPISTSYADGWITNNEAGTITVYNIRQGFGYPYVLRIVDYAGIAEKFYNINEIGFTQVNLVAKSISAEFKWSGDSVPVVGKDFELFYYSGTEWISVGIFTTNASGMFLVNLLPIGVYKFDEMEEFSITANDVIKTVVSTVESLCVKKSFFSFGLYRDVETKYFFFFVKIKLTMVFPELWQIGFLSFRNIPSTFFYASATAQFTLLKEVFKL